MEHSKTALNEAGGDRVDLNLLARLDLGSKLRFDRQLVDAPATVTYLAHEKRKRRPVLLRVVDRLAVEDAGALDALQTNLSEAAALEHPGIVPLYDFGVTEHTVWWTSQFVDAPSLADVIRSEGRLRMDRVLRIAKRVADALLHAHDHGLAHGGLTPEAVLIRADDWAVVADFVHPSACLGAGAAQIARSPGADQRALAVMIYRSLTGEVDRTTTSLLADLGSTTVLQTRQPQLSPVVVFSLVRAADPDPYRQFGSPADLVGALDTSPPPGVPAPKPTPPPQIEILVPEPDPALAQQQRSGHRLLAVFALVVLAFVGLWIGFTRLLEPPADAMPVVSGGDSAATGAPNAVMPPAAPLPPPGAVAQVPPPAPINSKPAAAKHPPPKRQPAHPVERIERAKAAAPPAPVVPSDQTARLLVRSVPGGTLYVDDRLIGPATEMAVPVSAGHHVVRITKPGFRRYLSMVDVASGEERRLSDVVLEPEK
jgi:serine/threonine-protein kinase